MTKLREWKANRKTLALRSTPKYWCTCQKTCSLFSFFLQCWGLQPLLNLTLVVPLSHSNLFLSHWQKAGNCTFLVRSGPVLLPMLPWAHSISWHWPRHNTLMSISGLLPECLLLPGRFSQIFPWLAPSCLSGLSSISSPQISLPQAPPLHSLWHLQGHTSSYLRFIPLVIICWPTSVSPRSTGILIVLLTMGLHALRIVFGTSDTWYIFVQWIHEYTGRQNLEQQNKATPDKIFMVPESYI